MKKNICIWIIALMLCLWSAAIGDARELPDDSNWTPPDLSEVTTEHPELLILKVAQEELGYVE